MKFETITISPMVGKGTTVLAQGIKVICEPYNIDGRKDNRLMRVLAEDGQHMYIWYHKAHEKLQGFVQITEHLVNDCLAGNSVSITGEKCDPEGYDQYGFPSILRIMRYVQSES